MAKYKYLNVNPKKITINDCVTRAISLATGMPYYEVRDLLTQSAKDIGCCRICRPCYTIMLKRYFDLDVIEDGYHTAGEVADMYPNNTLLIRTSGHLTSSIDDTIYDIFDCRNELCTHYWIVKK